MEFEFMKGSVRGILFLSFLKPIGSCEIFYGKIYNMSCL